MKGKINMKASDLRVGMSLKLEDSEKQYIITSIEEKPIGFLNIYYMDENKHAGFFTDKDDKIEDVRLAHGFIESIFKLEQHYNFTKWVRIWKRKDKQHSTKRIIKVSELKRGMLLELSDHQIWYIDSVSEKTHDVLMFIFYFNNKSVSVLHAYKNDDIKDLNFDNDIISIYEQVSGERIKVWSKESEDNKMMTKGDLKSGMLVTIRDVFRGRGRVFLHTNNDIDCIIFPTGFEIVISNINEDLTNKMSKDFDIIEVRTPVNPDGYIFDNDKDTKVIWTRKEHFKIKDLKTGMLVVFGDQNSIFNGQIGRVLLNTELGDIIVFNTNIDIKAIKLGDYNNREDCVDKLGIIEIFKPDPNNLRGYLTREKEFRKTIWKR
jgi:hypothetical protein